VHFLWICEVFSQLTTEEWKKSRIAPSIYLTINNYPFCSNASHAALVGASFTAANEVLGSRSFTPNWEQRSPYLERLSAEVKILSMNPSFLKRSYWLHRDDFMNVLSKIKNHVQTLQYFRMPRAQDFWIRKVHFPELCLTGEQMHFCEKCVFYMHFSNGTSARKRAEVALKICTFPNMHFSKDPKYALFPRWITHLNSTIFFSGSHFASDVQEGG